MKAQKIISNILIGLGSVLFFVGMFALVLPQSDNRQIQLLITSFQTPSDNLFLQWMNNSMTAAMQHCIPLLIIGLVLVLLGMLILFSLRTETPAPQPARQPVVHAAAVAANPYARTQPAAGNPFARYIAADQLPKSTQVCDEELPQPEFVPMDSEGAATTVADNLPPADEEPDQDGEQLFALVEDDEDDNPLDGGDYFPLQTDDEEDAPLPVALPAEEEESLTPPLPQVLPLSEEEALEEAVEETAEEAIEEASGGDAAQPVVVPFEAEEQPQPDLQANDQPDREQQEETVLQQQPSPARAVPAGNLRPVIRSTFHKSTPQTAGESAENAVLQPASRIKSTMGHKR